MLSFEVANGFVKFLQNVLLTVKHKSRRRERNSDKIKERKTNVAEEKKELERKT